MEVFALPVCEMQFTSTLETTTKRERIGLKMSNYQQAIRAIFSWPDRIRVFNMLLNVPTPLMLAYLSNKRIVEQMFTNDTDMKIFRLVQECGYELPDEVLKAVVAFGVRPQHLKLTYRKKKEDDRPNNFSPNDKYWRQLVDLNPEIRNEVRETNKVLPKGMKKRMEKISSWI